MKEFFMSGVMSDWMAVFISSMMPIIELRGAIPIGSYLGLDPIYSALLAILGSTVPVPFIILLGRPVINALKASKLLKDKVERFLEKTLKKSEQVQKYEFWGLAIFVGVPLPGTGAWTGSLIALLLGISFKRALLSIFIGNVIAGTIVFILTQITVNSIRLFF